MYCIQYCLCQLPCQQCANDKCECASATQKMQSPKMFILVSNPEFNHSRTYQCPRNIELPDIVYKYHWLQQYLHIHKWVKSIAFLSAAEKRCLQVVPKP